MKTNPFLYLRYYFSTRIKQRLLISYFLLIVVPFGLFALSSYRNAYTSVESLLNYSAQQSFNQALAFITAKLEYGTQISEAIVVNDDMRLFAGNTDADRDAFTKNINYFTLNAIRDSFLRLRDIYEIRFYATEKQMYIDMDTYLDIEKVKTSKWYQKLSTSKSKYMWVYFENQDLVNENEPTVSLVRFVADQYNLMSRVAILRIDYKEQDIKKILLNTSATYNTMTFLLAPDNQIISSSVEEDQWMGGVNYNELKVEADNNQKKTFQSSMINNEKVFMHSQTIKNTDLILVTIIPQKEILRPSKRIQRDMFILLFLVSITAGIFSYMLSKSIIKRRNFQLKALQGQINPHFLYNTLDLINWTAIDYNVPQISSLVILLSKFYKLSLNKGKDVISIADELEHARIYIAIQNMRLDQKINVVFDVSEAILNYKVIKIVLQPIIENAILHGIMEKENKSGNLTIRGRLEGNRLLLIIIDNGVGIKTEDINNILINNSADEHGGYGLKNIDERIKLFYGNKFGLSINSQINIGTTVTVTIPAIKDYKKS